MPALSSMVSCISARSVAIRSCPPVLRRNFSSRRRPSSSACASTGGPGSRCAAAKAAAASPARAPQPRHSVRDVGRDAARQVVDDGADGNRLLDRIDVLVLEAQLPDEGELRVDHLCSQVAEVQVNVMAVWAFERAPLLLLLDERLREPIARAEL